MVGYAMNDRRPKNQKLEPFVTLDPARWQDQPVPARRWLVQDILVRGSVTLVTGDGGVGKSLLAQQLMTAMALGGEDWLGIDLPSDPVATLGIFCEDDEEELHRRQEDINRAYGIEMKDLAGLVTYVSRVGNDNILIHYDRSDQAGATPFHEQVTNKIRESKAQLIVIDTIADTFGGNENIRPQVRNFINTLRKWPMEMDGGLIVTGHPSQFGLSQGTGISGSTAWNNSVRGRVYLTKPKADDDEEPDPNERLLKTMKSNYGPAGDQLRLRWDQGVFKPVHAAAPDGGIVNRLELENAIKREVKNLMADGVLVGAYGKAKNGITTLLSKLPTMKSRWTWNEIETAKERLLASGDLVRIEVGPKSRSKVLIRPRDAAYREESE